MPHNKRHEPKAPMQLFSAFPKERTRELPLCQVKGQMPQPGPIPVPLLIISKELGMRQKRNLQESKTVLNSARNIVNKLTALISGTERRKKIRNLRAFDVSDEKIDELPVWKALQKDKSVALLPCRNQTTHRGAYVTTKSAALPAKAI